MHQDLHIGLNGIGEVAGHDGLLQVERRAAGVADGSSLRAARQMAVWTPAAIARVASAMVFMAEGYPSCPHAAPGSDALG